MCVRCFLILYSTKTYHAPFRRWEVPLDDVMLNGQTLPKPQLSDGVGYTALVDSVSFSSAVLTYL